jgi:hypothetical protein
MSRIVWLASYPKSGNTWLRVFLANLQGDGEGPADINNLDILDAASSRRAADDALGAECSDLTPEELDRYRPAVYRSIANRSEKTLFIKTHDAYLADSGGEPFFPADVTQAAVYLVRNPLDVAVSFARHRNTTVDDTIDRMSRNTESLAGSRDRLELQLPQRLLSWSQHVSSWLDQRAIHVRIIRYEDIHADPCDEFSALLRFVGMEVDAERVRRAVTFSSFDALRRQELDHGFRERPSGATSFFRSGRIGGWRETLTAQQVEQVVRDHGAMMSRLGYLPG